MLEYSVMLSVKEKSKIVSEHRVHEKDTGSPEVQIALATEEITRLADHLKKHPKDNHSRRGLLQMVSKRKSLMTYLAHEDEKRHKNILKKLGLKK